MLESLRDAARRNAEESKRRAQKRQSVSDDDLLDSDLDPFPPDMVNLDFTAA